MRRPAQLPYVARPTQLSYEEKRSRTACIADLLLPLAWHGKTAWHWLSLIICENQRPKSSLLHP
jgi:hypothetical protein